MAPSEECGPPTMSAELALFAQMRRLRAALVGGHWEPQEMGVASARNATGKVRLTIGLLKLAVAQERIQ